MFVFHRSENIEKGERYIAPIYNQIIRDGMKVYIEVIPSEAVHDLGRPEEINKWKNKTAKI